jgi:hypothetical protein
MTWHSSEILVLVSSVLMQDVVQLVSRIIEGFEPSSNKLPYQTCAELCEIREEKCAAFIAAVCIGAARIQTATCEKVTGQLGNYHACFVFAAAKIGVTECTIR